MKKIGIIVLFVLLAAGTVCFLPKPAGPKTGGKLTVVTSGYVAYTLTRQLAAPARRRTQELAIQWLQKGIGGRCWLPSS